MIKFSESHEWVLVDGETATIGITDHAQEELGDIVYVELPEVGRGIKANEESAVLESTKAAADVYSPISGQIVSVNDDLTEKPELVNESPQDKGWLFKIKLTNKEELEDLMDETAYKKLLS